MENFPMGSSLRPQKFSKKIAILWDGQLGMLSSIAAQDLWHDVMIFGDVWVESPAGKVSTN
jgi:phosphoribosylaminoimidazole carboxylase (NCAIR synthetase)